MFTHSSLILVLFLSVANAKIHKPGSRIIGGEAANIEDFPHQISLIFLDIHFCGGSIIHPQYILTAAHCVDGQTATDFKVRAGSSLIDQGGQVVNVEEIYSHPKYDSDTYDYDISILKLKTSLQLGVGVSTISLPQQGSPIPGGTAVATGWGRLYENGPMPSQLQKVELPVLSQEVCSMIYGNQVTSRMFCAGYPEGGKDTCQGDSGGPLVLEGFLLGITSWGDGCGAMNTPGVYTVVSEFIDYIKTIVPL